MNPGFNVEAPLRLTFSEIQTIHTIVGECCDLWADPAAWQAHLLSRAATLSDCRLGIYYELEDGPDKLCSKIISATDVGWSSDSERRTLIEGIATKDLHYSPFWAAFTSDLTRRDGKTMRQRAVIEDRRWHLSEMYDRYLRPTQLGEAILSAVWMPHRSQWSMWCIANDRSDRTLTAHQEACVSVLHRLIAPLIGTTLCTFHSRSIAVLSQRRRDVLSLLLDGNSEKQIAAAMCRSRGAVHEHVAHLYRHFGVFSRGELAAYQPAPDRGSIEAGIPPAGRLAQPQDDAISARSLKPGEDKETTLRQNNGMAPIPFGSTVACGDGMPIVLTCHHDDFDLWNSTYHSSNAVKMGPHRDIVGDWQKAAKAAGLPFGVSEHLGASYNWFQIAHDSDKKGPLAGVPYDGADPAYQELYHPPSRDLAALTSPHLSYTNDPVNQEDWQRRIHDRIDQYHPDLLYSDGGLPFGAVGEATVAHLYNTSIAAHGGKLEAVYNCKKTRTGEFDASACVQDVERGLMPDMQPYPWQTDTSNGDWFYRANDKYKSAADVLHELTTS